MAILNPTYNQLQSSYVFRHVNQKAAEFVSNNPDKPVLKMGVGNTTLPLAPMVVSALHEAVNKLADASTYSGYGDELGEASLRSALADYYHKAYGVALSADEFVLSDGAKSDTANIPSIFTPGTTVAVQNPVYPVYVESNVALGNQIQYMPCTSETGFVPSAPDSAVDIMYLCSPNNPTGTVATREQLQELVDYANKNSTVLVFDAAYSAFVRDESLPRSIYEIPGAETCAIEVNSFSKWAGFTGVRLAWTIVPEALVTGGSNPGEVLARWRRRQLIYFNGPSNIAQAGGLAALTETGISECDSLVDYYLENAHYIKKSLEKSGLEVYGGDNSPYIWVKTPKSLTSWEFFDKLLDHTQVVTTPGVGFGSEGEGYVRFSAFASLETTHDAMDRIRTYLSSTDET